MILVVFLVAVVMVIWCRLQYTIVFVVVVFVVVVVVIFAVILSFHPTHSMLPLERSLPSNTTTTIRASLLLFFMIMFKI